MVKPDVRESERLNKQLSLFGARCPSGGLDLCSGRLAMRHFLGQGGYGQPGKRKYSDVKPAARLLMDACLEGWPLLHEVEGNEERFAPTRSRQDLPSLSAAKTKMHEIAPEDNPRPTAARIWAASMNKKFREGLSSSTDSTTTGLIGVAFLLPPKQLDDTSYLFVLTDKTRTTWHMACCKREEAGRFVLLKPLSFVRSHDVLCRFYQLSTPKNPVDVQAVEVQMHVTQAARL